MGVPGWWGSLDHPDGLRSHRRGFESRPARFPLNEEQLTFTIGIPF